MCLSERLVEISGEPSNQFSRNMSVERRKRSSERGDVEHETAECPSRDEKKLEEQKMVRKLKRRYGQKE